MNSVVRDVDRVGDRAAPASGSVESSTCSRSAPSAGGLERRNTSGARLEPPMPSSTTSVMPSVARRRRRSARISSRSSSSLSAIVSQPSRSSSSGVPAGAQSVPSRRQIRRTTSSSRALRSRSATGCSSSGGRSASNDAGRPVTIASRLASMPASSLFIGTTNASMPSRRSWSVTSPRSIPAAAQRLEVGRRVEVGGRAGHLAVALGGLQRRQRHRVDGVGPDEAVDVHRLGVGRVLDAGRRPQRALDRAAGRAQRRELVAAEDALEGLVGAAGVGEPGAALQVGVARAPRAACRPRCRRARRRTRRPSGGRAAGPRRGGAPSRG